MFKDRPKVTGDYLKMKLFFSISFGVLVLLSVLAWAIKPPPTEHGKTPLVWVSDDNPVRRDQIDLFNRLNPNYLLKLDPSNVNMEKVIVQSLAGVGPDLFCVYDAFGLSTYVKSGIAWDVTDKLTECKFDIQSQVWSCSYPTFMFEERAYGFPANVAADALWYNKEIFDKAKLPYPKGPMTWQEFIALAQKMTIRDERGRAKQYGFLMDWSGQWTQFVLQWGGQVYSPDGTRCTLDSPEAIAGMQFMHDLVYKYHVMPSPVEEAAMATQGGWNSGPMTWFGGAKGATALGGRWWLCTLRDYKDLRLGATEAPHGPKRVFRGYAKGIIINKNSPRREQALEFLKYMYGKDYNVLVNNQADALGPVKQFTYIPEYLKNPKFPAEDFNDVWRDIMNYTVAEPVSPFISGQKVVRIATRQLDLIKNDQKPVPDAMRTLTEQVNAEIRKSIEADPSLRERYKQVTGKDFQ